MKRVFLNNVPEQWTDSSSYLEDWLFSVAEMEGFTLRKLTYSFVKDDEMLGYNQRLLNHDYYTDIITYGQAINGRIEGDIIIGWERIIDNSKLLNTNDIDERDRVIVHGLIHLCGYDDQIEEDKLKMRQLEDKYLALRP